jgi:pimeloyl-ACP methyl ester carboxylesterase
MSQSLPIILVPGLVCSPRIYAPQIPALWQSGPVMLANHIRDNTMAGIAKRILDEAPDEFALAGHSMGGIISLEIVRQAPERVKRLALLSTSARPETTEVAERRRGWIAETKAGGYHSVLDKLFAIFVHPSRLKDASLHQIVRDMGNDVGPEAFVDQLEAIMSRADSRPLLSSITCPTLVLTSDTDNTVPNTFSTELANNIPGAKLVVIPDCGHLVQLEKPEATAAAMLDWLRM